METATDHDSMIRAQAKAQLLKQLFGPSMEQHVLARHQTTNTVSEAYMSRDAFEEESPDE